MSSIENDLNLYDVRYSAGGATEAGWYLEKQDPATDQIEWVKGPGTVEDVVTALTQELNSRWEGDVDPHVQWWAKEKMDTARRDHIMNERPAAMKALHVQWWAKEKMDTARRDHIMNEGPAAMKGLRGDDRTEQAGTDAPAIVRLSVDKTGRLHGELPDAVESRPVRDPEYAAYTVGNQRTGFLVNSGRPIELVVEVPSEAPLTNITLSCIHDGSVTLQGNGNGDAVHIGPGPGDATRDGNGRGSARREGGHGNAIRSGSGNGEAERWYRGSGNAARSGNGHGDAIRKDEGDGSAVRSGNGRGDAVRDGLGRGNAIVKSNATGSARVGNDVNGDAIRSGTGDGHALVTDHAKGDARIGRNARGTATNRSEYAGDAMNGSDREGNAVREGSGRGSAIRDGAGTGNANRGGDGGGHAWRGGGGNGDAANTSTGQGNAARSGQGEGEAKRQGTNGHEWAEEQHWHQQPAWLDELVDKSAAQRMASGPRDRTGGENAEAWVVGDINGDIHEPAGVFASNTACEEHIRDHMDGTAQREYGEDSMFVTVAVPASREAGEAICKKAPKLETDPTGPGAAAAERWEQAVTAATEGVDDEKANRRKRANGHDVGEKSTTASTAVDHETLRELLRAAAEVHKARETPVDPLGPERELIEALQIGEARIKRAAELDDRRQQEDRATAGDRYRTPGPAAAPVAAPAPATGAAKAARTSAQNDVER